MADATPERWSPVVGYEGIYEVSDHGRVRRVAPRRGGRAVKFLQGRTTEKGYQRVSLRRDGTTRRHTIHSLVLEAFIGSRPGGHECNHKDGDKQNNQLANLEWVTGLQNMQHAARTGLMTPTPIHGERNGGAKLTREQVAEIRRLDGRFLQREIAAMYGISRSRVSEILHGVGWRAP